MAGGCHARAHDPNTGKAGLFGLAKSNKAGGSLVG